MTQRLSKALSCLTAVLCLGLLGGNVGAQESVQITDDTTAGIVPVTLEVLLTNEVAVQGFVLAIGYDTTLATVTGVGVAGTETESVGAELVVAEIFDNFSPALGGFTLGVVLDTQAPFNGQVIGPGNNLEIANFEVTPQVTVPEGDPPIEVDFDFMDGTFNSPLLDNILVEGGNSIDIVPIGSGGTLTLTEAPPDLLTITDAAVAFGGTGSAEIILSNSTGAVQGFVLAIVHDAGVELEEINLDDTVTDDVGAEFVVADVSDPSGGTLAVVLDFEGPFDGQTIPVGASNHIANYVYSCVEGPVDPEPATEHALTFVNGELGSPPLDNVIVVAGLSYNPGFVNGTAFCLPRPLVDTVFYLGADDGDGNITSPHGFPGETVSVCWWYSDPTNNMQGFQGAMCINGDSIGVLSFVADSFDVSDTIIDAVGAEFVSQSVDNDFGDDDGLEQTVGILLDALPPFDDQTAPQTSQPLKLGCFGVLISDEADCSECYEIEFCNGIDASETVELDNLIVSDFASELVSQFQNTEICIDSLPQFLRADCNGDGRVNLADAASVLGYQFHHFAVGCLDACDSNDDGKINLADTVFDLNYLYKSGNEPPDPFPSLGTDPTEDSLDCADGTDGCS